MHAKETVRSPTVLTEKDYYNSRELRVILARHRGRAVPDRTLRFWRKRLEIKPDKSDLYNREDLRVLVRLVRWINRGGTIDGFRSILKSEVKAEQADPDTQEQVIDVKENE